METVAEKQALYQLIAAQLRNDGFIGVADAVLRTTAAFPPPPETEANRLLELVRVGWKCEPHAKGEGGVDLMKGLDLEGPPPTKSPLAGVQERRCNFTHRNVVKSIRFSPDGKYVAIGSADGLAQIALAQHIRATPTTQVLEDASAIVLRNFDDHTQAVNDVCFHPTSPLLFTASRDCNVRGFQYTQPDKLQPLHTFADNFACRAIDVHPTGNLLVSCTDDFSLRFWDVASGKLYGTPSHSNDCHMSPVNMVRYSLDGKLFATGGLDGAVKIWDGTNCKCINTIPAAHSGADVTSVQFSKTGKFLLTGGRDGQARLWDLSTGRNIKWYGASSTMLQGKTNPNLINKNVVTFNFTENCIACTDESGCQCTIIDARTGAETVRLGGHTSTLRYIATSPTEQMVITSCDDKQVRAWAPPSL
eukprot:TRINITY_DN59220_c1_g1_i1.p1 TRINITY_DN59220_c1_g1~~TRINITY_DN59220_c1_g1_i1.p1  ORF type:complete len:418 (-),score=29.94 TRINITY_DN59220_c1_g1_i1:32-1285(-)